MLYSQCEDMNVLHIKELLIIDIVISKFSTVSCTNMGFSYSSYRTCGIKPEKHKVHLYNI
jgi:hypothetical protein